jgi:hypothetical protein
LETLNQALYLALNANADAPQVMLSFAKFMAEWHVGIATLLATLVVFRQGKGRKLVLSNCF